MKNLDLGPVPDVALRALGENAAAEARLLIAIQLFVEKRLTAGGAAELAGLSKVAFIHKLSEHGVPPYEMTGADLERDTTAALRAAGR